jgi:hypothetical protein
MAKKWHIGGLTLDMAKKWHIEGQTLNVLNVQQE